MPIVSDTFGKLTTILIKNEYVNISTARENTIIRYSTVISVGKYPKIKLITKIIYRIRCSSEQRERAHSLISRSIVVGMDEFNRELEDAIKTGVESVFEHIGPIIKEIQKQK
jgi:hypothetical protein